MIKEKNDESYVGSNFDGFLADEGILEDVTAKAVERVAAWEAEEKLKQ